jgi:hypothetical protein
VATSCKFATGEYEWDVFIPKFEATKRTSVGAFLYSKEPVGGVEPEIDFEIGYGTEDLRKACHEMCGIEPRPDRAVCHMRVHGPGVPENKGKGMVFLDVESWYNLKISFIAIGGLHDVTWLIDGKQRHRVAYALGDANVEFPIICSLEVIDLMGEEPPVDPHAVFFTRVAYTYVPPQKKPKPWYVVLQEQLKSARDDFGDFLKKKL